jgi:hypothetical protein
MSYVRRSSVRSPWCRVCCLESLGDCARAKLKKTAARVGCDFVECDSSVALGNAIQFSYLAQITPLNAFDRQVFIKQRPMDSIGGQRYLLKLIVICIGETWAVGSRESELLTADHNDSDTPVADGY